MKQLITETSKCFSIICLKCNGKVGKYDFTMNGDIVFFCPACCNTSLIQKR